ncbi:D-Ala-D-Ala carboxypeptidase family metallohydrolase [Microbulbifer sp. TRSA007]|uniref:D-Ala-D-Ala carboxypeptidase family metallohydrolase n=1 Tax=Microbulbifer sp. TRSA007 TaxID=3243384 RepID=UPI00403A64B7
MLCSDTYFIKINPPCAGFFVSGALIFDSDYFTEAGLSRRCCKKNYFKDETFRCLIKVRELYGNPIIIISSYHCRDHNARL